MNQSSKFQFGFIALDYHFYAITIIITITTKHLSLPEWSIGLLALPLLFLTVFSRSTVIVKLKDLHRHCRGSRSIFTPSEKSLWHNTRITVCLFFLSSDHTEWFFSCTTRYMFAICSAVHEELKKSPCMWVEEPARGQNLTQSNQTSPSGAPSYQVQSALASHFDISPHMQFIKPKVWLLQTSWCHLSSRSLPPSWTCLILTRWYVGVEAEEKSVTFRTFQCLRLSLCQEIPS